MYNMYRSHNPCSVCQIYSCPYCPNAAMNYYPHTSNLLAHQYTSPIMELECSSTCGVLSHKDEHHPTALKDYGPKPFVVNIDKATKQNDTFRTALWTGKCLQVTVMSICPGEDIGLEVHPKGDQFIRVEEGEGIVKMGDSKCNLDFQRRICEDDAIMIPACKWHNIINTGDKPLKLYAIYAPPEHPRCTVHPTKADAEAAQKH